MTRVITVTLNPAIDVTYEVPALTLGTSVRVATVRSRAGGKGVNVAAVVRQLGGDPIVVAPTTLTEPDPFRSGLAALGLPHRLIPSFGTVRRTVAVVGADGLTTILLEPGSRAAPDTTGRIAGTVTAELAGAGALVISGSLAPGLPDDLPAQLARAARAQGVPVIADVSGPALRAVATAGAVLTPNRDEFAELTGHQPGSTAEIVTRGRELIGAGAAAVLVTLGEDGAVAVTNGGAWHARTAGVAGGNPTGAGDAAAAALALHLARGAAWPAALTDAVASSAACVLRPVAGDIDLEARSRRLGAVTVKELP
jgi:tagatose 6-phosphate kinase